MENLNVEIRKMTDEDLPAVLEIENLCFPATWKEEDFKHEIHENPFSNPWVIELSYEKEHLKSVVGFSIYWKTFDSATLCKIAVHPEIQHHSLGNAMMDEIYNDCYAQKVRYITLEVRKSNQNAINFYKKHGFVQTSVKEHYYSNGEDALYMVLEVK